MRSLIKKVPALRRAYYRQLMKRPKSQSDEAAILGRLSAHSEKTFVEFGFHPTEFNCSLLARTPGWRGLLIDGDKDQVEDARHLLPHSVEVVQRFVDLDNINLAARHFRKIGVLSIDVDGNDYWFLEALITAEPDVISVEYNSTLGLDPISVPYDPAFDRHMKHPRGWYHGASLTALAKLSARFGYGLAAVSANGCNAFFTRDGALDPKEAWRPNSFREKHSTVSHERQWDAVRHLPFITV